MRPRLFALLAFAVPVIAAQTPPPAPAPPADPGYVIPLHASDPMGPCVPRFEALIGGGEPWGLTIHAATGRTYTIEYSRITWEVPREYGARSVTLTAGDIARFLAIEPLACTPSRTALQIELVYDDVVHRGPPIGADSPAGRGLAALLHDIEARDAAATETYLAAVRPIGIRLARRAGGHRYELHAVDREILVLCDDRPVATRAMSHDQLLAATYYMANHPAARRPLATGELVTAAWGKLPFQLARHPDGEVQFLADALVAASCTPAR